MDKDYLNHRAGDTIVLSNGCYSDYCFSGPYKVLVDFSMLQAAENHCKLFKPNSWHSKPNASGFEAYLVTSGLIEQIESKEIHLGDYSNLRIDKRDFSEEWEAANVN